MCSRVNVYWRSAPCLIKSVSPALRTQLIVLQAVVGAFGRRLSANAARRLPTHSAAMAQQIRLSAPRNVSSLKLRHMPDLNILSRSTLYLQKSLNRSCNQERFRSCNGAHRLERVTPVPTSVSDVQHVICSARDWSFLTRHLPRSAHRITSPG